MRGKIFQILSVIYCCSKCKSVFKLHTNLSKVIYFFCFQLSKISSATLQAWLKSRGINVRSKDKKEELVSKVMKCLSET